MRYECWRHKLASQRKRDCDVKFTSNLHLQEVWTRADMISVKEWNCFCDCTIGLINDRSCFVLSECAFWYVYDIIFKVFIKMFAFDVRVLVYFLLYWSLVWFCFSRDPISGIDRFIRLPPRRSCDSRTREPLQCHSAQLCCVRNACWTLFCQRFGCVMGCYLSICNGAELNGSIYIADGPLNK